MRVVRLISHKNITYSNNCDKFVLNLIFYVFCWVDPFPFLGPYLNIYICGIITVFWARDRVEDDNARKRKFQAPIFVSLYTFISDFLFNIIFSHNLTRWRGLILGHIVGLGIKEWGGGVNPVFVVPVSRKEILKRFFYKNTEGQKFCFIVS